MMADGTKVQENQRSGMFLSSRKKGMDGLPPHLEVTTGTIGRVLRDRELARRWQVRGGAQDHRVVGGSIMTSGVKSANETMKGNVIGIRPETIGIERDEGIPHRSQAEEGVIDCSFEVEFQLFRRRQSMDFE